MMVRTADGWTGPAFLTKGAGMFSGLMLSQYTAGALICENRILSHPAATGSIPQIRSWLFVNPLPLRSASGSLRSAPGQFAAQYCAFIFGIVYQWLVNAQALDLDAVFDNYIANTTALLGNPDFNKETAS